MYEQSVLERELHGCVRSALFRIYGAHKALEIYRQVARGDRGADYCLWYALELALTYSISPKDIAKVQEIL